MNARIASIEETFGPHFLLEVDLEAVRRCASSPNTTLEFQCVQDEHEGISQFTRADDNEARERRTARIDSFLKAFLLLQFLDVKDYFFILYDCPRRAVGEGMLLEQRYQAFELLFQCWCQKGLSDIGSCDAGSGGEACDKRRSILEEQEVEKDSNSVAQTTFLQSSPFGQFYASNFERCLEEVCVSADRWQTAFESWARVARILPNKDVHTVKEDEDNDDLTRYANGTACSRHLTRYADGTACSHLDNPRNASSPLPESDDATAQASPDAPLTSSPQQSDHSIPSPSRRKQDAPCRVYQPFFSDGVCATHVQGLE
ncbi:unnamed protein product, partial [Amoebophrya sp. A25]|eukprot:GSA25T00018446001.1